MQRIIVIELLMSLETTRELTFLKQTLAKLQLFELLRHLETCCFLIILEIHNTLSIKDKKQRLVSIDSCYYVLLAYHIA